MKKYILLVVFLVSVLLITPNVSFGATSAEIQSQIQAIMAQIQALQQKLAQLQNQQGDDRAWCHTFNTNLMIGNTGDEVNALQTALQKEGFSISSDEMAKSGGTPGVAYSLPATFGESTASAITGFQEKYRAEVLTPVGLKYGTGYVGKSTRAKLNQLYGCGVITPKPEGVGYLDIEPSSASIAVGESKSFQAFYQPPMPKCDTPGIACLQVMPARIPIEAEWTSSNSGIATVSYKEGPALQSIPIIRTYDRKTAVVSGISNGTADIKASYKSPLGTVLTVTAKVIVVGVNMPTPTNIAPKIIGIPAIPSSLQPGQSVSFSWNAMDADRDNLRWSGSWGDGIGFAGACPVSASNLTIGTNSGTNFMAFHNWSKAGIYKVQVSVTDCKGGSDTNTFNVTVSGASGTNVQYPINQ